MRKTSFVMGVALLGALPAAAPAQEPRPGVIFPDDLDRFHAEIVVGRPGNFTFARGPALESGVAGRRATGPGHVVFDREGNMYAACDTFIQVVTRDGTVYLMDANWLRKFDGSTVTTLNAGTGSANGPLATAQFNRWMSQGAGLTFGNDGELYVADRWNMAVRKVDLEKGEVTTYCGAEPGAEWGRPRDGPALEARFHGGGGPYQVLFARKHGFLLAKSADEDTMRIVKDGRMMTFGFTGGNSSRRALEGPIRSLAGGYVTPIGEDAEGNIYVGNNNRIGQIIRKVTKEPAK